MAERRTDDSDIDDILHSVYCGMHSEYFTHARENACGIMSAMGNRRRHHRNDNVRTPRQEIWTAKWIVYAVILASVDVIFFLRHIFSDRHLPGLQVYTPASQSYIP